MRLPTRRKALIVAGCLVVLLLAAGGVYLRPGIVFLSRVTDGRTPERGTGEREVTIERGGHRLRGRVYRPDAGHRRALLLVHGVHYRGIDEERLVPLARKLAGMGFAVITPEIRDLARYEIRPHSVDQIEQAALWALEQPELVPAGGQLGVLGISFGGGLSVSAASRASLKGRLAFVLSFGGHADLDRVMRYLVTGKLPGGGELPAHIYGVAVLLRQFADKLVPPAQVAPLRRCVLAYLQDRTAEARALQAALPSPARELAGHCLERQSAELGRKLRPLIARIESPPALSPLRCPQPDCPVFLLHGSVDNVIPPSESTSLGRRVGAHVLISPLVVHVEVEPAGWRQMLDLALFCTRWLRR